MLSSAWQPVCLLYDYKDALFRLDPKLRDFRVLKEKYIHFNNRNAGKPLEARKELDELILCPKQLNTKSFEISETY